VVSHDVASARAIGILEAAAAASATSERVVRPVLARLIPPVDVDTTAGERRKFLELLDEARRFAATACVLARTAKLEATYGGALAVPLAEAAASFTELADSVDDSVRTIARRLSARRWSKT